MGTTTTNSVIISRQMLQYHGLAKHYYTALEVDNNSLTGSAWFAIHTDLNKYYALLQHCFGVHMGK